MTDAEMTAYILFASLMILVFCSAGLVALLGWVIPDAVAALRDHAEDSPAAVYSRWQLFRLGMHCLKLSLFLVPAVTVLVMEMGDLRLLINITALLLIAIATTAITEPVARRQVEAAIKVEDAETVAEKLLRSAEATAATLLKHAETTATELREETAGDAETIRHTVRDTNETARRMEKKLEEDNVISSGKQDVAAGKQDVAANQQQTDIDLSELTQQGVDRLEQQRQKEKEHGNP